MNLHDITIFLNDKDSLFAVARTDAYDKNWKITLRFSSSADGISSPMVTFYIPTFQQLSNLKASLDHALNVARMELSNG